MAPIQRNGSMFIYGHVILPWFLKNEDKIQSAFEKGQDILENAVDAATEMAKETATEALVKQDWVFCTETVFCNKICKSFLFKSLFYCFLYNLYYFYQYDGYSKPGQKFSSGPILMLPDWPSDRVWKSQGAKLLHFLEDKQNLLSKFELEVNFG